jgi:hypothetical protein
MTLVKSLHKYKQFLQFFYIITSLRFLKKVYVTIINLFDTFSDHKFFHFLLNPLLKTFNRTTATVCMPLYTRTTKKMFHFPFQIAKNSAYFSCICFLRLCNLIACQLFFSFHHLLSVAKISACNLLYYYSSCSASHPLIHLCIHYF